MIVVMTPRPFHAAQGYESRGRLLNNLRIKHFSYRFCNLGASLETDRNLLKLKAQERFVCGGAQRSPFIMGKTFPTI